jgi:hypothetical protein
MTQKAVNANVADVKANVADVKADVAVITNNFGILDERLNSVESTVGLLPKFFSIYLICLSGDFGCLRRYPLQSGESRNVNDLERGGGSAGADCAGCSCRIFNSFPAGGE